MRACLVIKSLDPSLHIAKVGSKMQKRCIWLVFRQKIDVSWCFYKKFFGWTNFIKFQTHSFRKVWPMDFQDASSKPFFWMFFGSPGAWCFRRKRQTFCGFQFGCWEDPWFLASFHQYHHAGNIEWCQWLRRWVKDISFCILPVQKQRKTENSYEFIIWLLVGTFEKLFQ